MIGTGVVGTGAGIGVESRGSMGGGMTIGVWSNGVGTGLGGWSWGAGMKVGKEG